MYIWIKYPVILFVFIRTPQQARLLTTADDENLFLFVKNDRNMDFNSGHREMNFDFYLDILAQYVR